MYSKKSKLPIRYKKVRYSNETTAINVQGTIAGNSNPVFPTIDDKKGVVLVQAATLQGTRKVKNMLLSISSIGNKVPILCAIVYVPQGTEATTLQSSATNQRAGASLYEPNQNVIMQFVLNPTNPDTMQGCNVQHFKTRLARNLDSGDSVVLVCTPAYTMTTDQDVRISGTFNYAISY